MLNKAADQALYLYIDKIDDTDLSIREKTLLIAANCLWVHLQRASPSSVRLAQISVFLVQAGKCV